MNYQTISDMVAAAAKMRQKLKDTVSGVSAEEANALPEGEKWSVANIVEHVAMVNGGGGKICGKLLSKAQGIGKSSDGSARISPEFIGKAMESATAKLEAPDTVQPRAGRTIEESLSALEANDEEFNKLIPLFETIDDTEPKFPHPYFGGLTATEWFAIKIAHEARHTRQIAALLEKVRR